MNDPRSLGEILAQEVFPRLHRLVDLADTPAHRARVAQEARRRDEAAHVAHVARADDRGVPRARHVRAVALARDVRITPALEALSGPLAARERGEPVVVVLLGPAGVGKTCALARAVARHPLSARYLAAADLADGGWASRDLRASLAAVDLLVVDETGLERDVTPVREVLCRRWDDGAATLLASNLTPDAWTTRYLDARLASRLGSLRGRWLVVLDGADLRLPYDPRPEDDR
jgi:hypothetical protein